MNSLFQTVTTCDLDDNVIALPTTQCLSQSIFVKDLALNMFIGVFDDEKKKPQRVIVNVELVVCPTLDWQADNIQNVVSYADIVDRIEKLSTQYHIELVETFAEKIIEDCFSYPEVMEVKATIEKPDVLSQVEAVGASIHRKRITA